MGKYVEMYLTSKDLRIGNYINYEMTTHVVSELHREKIIHYWINSGNDGYVTTYEQILSIPISHTEINKLGFYDDSDRDENTFYFENYCIVEEIDNYWFCRVENNKRIFLATFDFVHELQNLYFYHTKKELKY